MIFVFFPTECNAVYTNTLPFVSVPFTMQLKWSFWNERKNKSSLRTHISSVYIKHDSIYIFSLNKSCSYSSSCFVAMIYKFTLELLHTRYTGHAVCLWRNSFIFHMYKDKFYKFTCVMMNNNSEQPRGMECQWTKNYLVRVCVCMCVKEER